MKAAAWLFCAGWLSAQTVTVTGSVTNAITHEPVEGASVLLHSTGAPPSGANSDSSGSFRIPNVRSGLYQLRAFAMGFEGVWREIRVDAGADPPALHLTLTPWPGVRGRVLDPERQPVPRVRVRAMNPGNAPGVVYEAVTDAAGRYFLERLSPGQYHFLATPPPAGNEARPSELAPTWYPGVAERRETPSVSMTAGRDLDEYDIVLRRVAVFRISGKVVDERGEPAAGATVETGLTERKATAREDGTFELPRVRSGEEALRADWQRGDVRLRGFARLAVGRHDIENVVVRVAAPVAVSGEIELDGESRHRCEGDAILAPVDGLGERTRAEFTESGIRFERVYPGRYRLTVLPGWSRGRHYLESVRLGDRDITFDEVEVVPGMMPFRVVLRTGGASLRGTVEDGAAGMVVLTPQDERLRFRPFIVVASFEGRSFAVENVRPGDYYAVALQSSFNADEMQNAEYARPRLEGARSVRLERGATATTTLVYAKPAP